MNPLPLPDQRHLDAAEGWLGLGDPLASNEELDQISSDLRTHPLVLEMRYKICAELKHWDRAVGVAQEAANSLPDNPWGRFHLAYALHELKRTQEAYDILRPVVDKFPRDWLMRFNLACYSCQLGNLNEALTWLEQAIALAGGHDIRQMALADEDLKQLWEKIKGL
jgi:tetratricopeptide (TPR) repeat protein